eukprot:TRINITY_DN46835_c0_g1_i1.p1 TRINITY_DN46835_c0_g1~~TRINITY_DN46835_c0_g1_i1.p1  ORF type:complete len:325 (-),score=26.68 TRINITY_DN46835_c0_g1_i1:55-1029(-)
MVTKACFVVSTGCAVHLPNFDITVATEDGSFDLDALGGRARVASVEDDGWNVDVVSANPRNGIEDYSCSGQTLDRVLCLLRHLHDQFSDHVHSDIVIFRGLMKPDIKHRLMCIWFLAMQVSSSAWIAISLSVQDVVRLLPFNKADVNWYAAMIYVICQQLVVIVAFFVGSGGESFLTSHLPNSWHRGKLISLVSGSALLAYSSFMFLDWLKVPYLGSTSDETKDDDGPTVSYCNLLVCVIAGSTDNFCVYSTLLASAQLRLIPLAIGTVIGSIVVLMLTRSLSACQALSSLISKVPLWAMMGMLALWIIGVALLTPQVPAGHFG